MNSYFFLIDRSDASNLKGIRDADRVPAPADPCGGSAAGGGCSGSSDGRTAGRTGGAQRSQTGGYRLQGCGAGRSLSVVTADFR